MKIEVGKYYRARNGIKAYVSQKEVDHHFYGKIKYNLYRADYETGNMAAVDDDGKLFQVLPDLLDLIEEWKEPFNIKVWGIVYISEDGYKPKGYVNGNFPSEREAINRHKMYENPDNWAVVQLTGKYKP